MRQLTLDGVPVFVADGPPPLAAGLVFGVGRRDETFVHGGITHLVEHLAMRAVGCTTIDSNASVRSQVLGVRPNSAPRATARCAGPVPTAASWAWSSSAAGSSRRA